MLLLVALGNYAELSRRRRPDLRVDVWKVVEPLIKAASMTARPLPGDKSTIR